MSKTVLFQTLQFSIRTLFSSIWPIDRTLSGVTSPNQSGPGSNGIEGVFCIPQSPSITWISPSDCLVSYPGNSLVGVLPLCREAVFVFYSPSRLGKMKYSSFHGSTALQSCLKGDLSLRSLSQQLIHIAHNLWLYPQLGIRKYLPKINVNGCNFFCLEKFNDTLLLCMHFHNRCNFW